MSAARYHRRTDDDTAISSMNSTNRSKYYCTTLLFVVDNPLINTIQARYKSWVLDIYKCASCPI